MKTNFEKSVKSFMKAIFDSTSDFSSLTKAKLQKQYIEEKDCEEFNKEEKKIFNSILKELLVKYSDAINENQSQDASLSKSTREKKTNSSKTAKNSSNSKSKIKSNSADDNSSSDSEALVIDESNEDTAESKNKKSEDGNDEQEKDFSKENEKSEESTIDLSDGEYDPVNKSNSPVHQVNSPVSDSSSSCVSDEKENFVAKNKKRKKSSDKYEKDAKKVKEDNSSSEEDSSNTKKTTAPLKSKRALKSSDEDDAHSSSSDENDVDDTDNAKNSNEKVRSKMKNETPSEKRLERLKQYIRVAGIRIQSYQKLFEGCKTLKAKQEKLLRVLEKEGLKGAPSLEKCRKLKKKRERKQEIESLDFSNIISSEGRPKRKARSLYSESPSSPIIETNNTSDDCFRNMKDLLDSDQHDTPVKKPRLKPISEGEDSD